MAGKNIKGITIEIEGNTQPLQKALKAVDSSASKASREIKDIDKSLKFDTGNVTLLTQKQELLGKQVQTTKEKLEILKGAQSQVEAQFKSGEIGAEQYRAFQREVVQTENVLKGYERKLENVNQVLATNGQATENNISQINDLQHEQSQLASEMSKVTSSFELQESALDSNASEAERNALAQKKIGAQSEIVGKQISNLEKQLELTKKEYGENSTEANKMEAELNQAKITLNHLNDELNETKASADNAQDGLGTVTKVAKAEALQQVSEKLSAISDKLIDVGTDSLEAAAQVQASNAQFSTVFGDMEAQAREALNAIGDDMDIVPERLQGSFTQMASFAKTSGLDTSDALDLTSRATRAAADSAAFYDKSIESVTENLQSFLKGNYANDAALGISATETTRNAAANKLYGKSFNELSEAQKQLTLLQMVEDGNKLSGALGQAARESDGLENVMGNLKQSGTNALAAIGEPILEMLIPVFQELASVVKKVTEWFKNLSPSVKRIIAIVGMFVVVLGTLLPIILSIVAGVQFFMAGIAGLSVSFLPLIGIIAGVIAAIVLFIVGIKKLWEKNAAFRESVLNVWNAVQTIIVSVVQKVSSFVMSLWGALTNWWTQNQELIRSSAEKVWGAIQTVVQTVMSVLGPFLQGAWQNIQVAISTIWDLIKNNVQTVMTVVLNIIKAVMQIIKGDWSGAWQSIKNAFAAIWNGMKNTLSIILQAISRIISNTWNGVKGIISGALSSISGAVSSVWNRIAGTIRGVMSGISGTVSGVWNGIHNTISNAINSAKNAVSSAIGAIKGFMNFSWSIPRPKLPRFNISGGEAPWGFMGKGSLPRIDISWFAKGGIMTKPTLFGFNGNRAMVGGEAGAEAILPLNEKTLGAIGRAQAEAAGNAGNTFNFNITVNGNVDNPDELVEKLARQIEQFMVREAMV
ncbi:phage tail tape measure protein [Streptococcus cuniculi]|uniref:Phage tail tape measure protein n=1 Tax=Streptococcus cuniculi TaxID=1432788 RepID=A0A1Q8E6A4_9STRE|nr:phage tail tape measure protein [Streptococcus cuniculi]OLF47308.1 phage tail tape measure protein [Streptococcus cuniculi]